MEILEITQKVIDGKVIIDLPKSYNNQNVKVTVSTNIDDEENWANLPAHKRVEILKDFVGKDKFPNIKVGKYDVYYQ
ncbi:MAG: hypothetical protein KF781_00890 [Chitinophagaceae bacterium]|nr:hypothetical protein [Chitinophagaceae bacterium]MCW5905291.1 hypothetical protein [Chitinophagaceae bacterium]